MNAGDWKTQKISQQYIDNSVNLKRTISKYFENSDDSKEENKLEKKREEINEEKEKINEEKEKNKINEDLKDAFLVIAKNNIDKAREEVKGGTLSNAFLKIPKERISNFCFSKKKIDEKKTEKQIEKQIEKTRLILIDQDLKNKFKEIEQNISFEEENSGVEIKDNNEIVIEEKMKNESINNEIDIEEKMKNSGIEIKDPIYDNYGNVIIEEPPSLFVVEKKADVVPLEERKSFLVQWIISLIEDLQKFNGLTSSINKIFLKKFRVLKDFGMDKTYFVKKNIYNFSLNASGTFDKEPNVKDLKMNLDKFLSKVILE